MEEEERWTWASLAQSAVAPNTALQCGWLTTVVNQRVTLPKSALKDGSSTWKQILKIN